MNSRRTLVMWHWVVVGFRVILERLNLSALIQVGAFLFAIGADLELFKVDGVTPSKKGRQRDVFLFCCFKITIEIGFGAIAAKR